MYLFLNTLRNGTMGFQRKEFILLDCVSVKQAKYILKNLLIQQTNMVCLALRLPLNLVTVNYQQRPAARQRV